MIYKILGSILDDENSLRPAKCGCICNDEPSDYRDGYNAGIKE